MIFVALLAGSAFVVRYNGARSAQVDAASPVPIPPLPGAVTPASTPPLASAVAPVPTTRPSSETSSTPDEEIVMTPRLGLTGHEKLAHDKLGRSPNRLAKNVARPRADGMCPIALASVTRPGCNTFSHTEIAVR
jgi:hypothetical protein